MSELVLSVVKRVVWVVAILLTAVVAIGLQLDRESHKNGKVAATVPPLFRGYALETLARQAIANGDYDLALAYSRELVLRRPIPAENLSLFTNALIASGSGDSALPVLLLSAQRGWRDPFTQRVMAASAQQSNEFKIAAERLLALWRLGDQDETTKNLTRNLLADGRGLDEFGRGVVETDKWATNFLIFSTDELPIQTNQKIAAAFSRKNVTINCGRLAIVFKKLVWFGKAKTAAVIWRELCAGGDMTSEMDFRFKDLSRGVGPFDWQFPKQRGLTSNLVRRGKESILIYDNTSQGKVALLVRNSSLSSGSHVARVVGKETKSLDASLIILQINCFSADGIATSITKVPISGENTSFSISSAGCVGQQLAVLAGAGHGEIKNIIIN